MIDYWASFARDGRPVAALAPDWPAYATGGQYMLVRRHARTAGENDARHVRAERNGHVPPPRTRQGRVELERRARRARNCAPPAAGCD